MNEPGLIITEASVACCGQTAPKLVSWWTPAKFKRQFKGSNRRFPTLQETFQYRRKKRMSRMHTGRTENGIPSNSTISPIRFPCPLLNVIMGLVLEITRNPAQLDASRSVIERKIARADTRRLKRKGLLYRWMGFIQKISTYPYGFCALSLTQSAGNRQYAK